MKAAEAATRKAGEEKTGESSCVAEIEKTKELAGDETQKPEEPASACTPLEVNP